MKVGDSNKNRNLILAVALAVGLVGGAGVLAYVSGDPDDVVFAPPTPAPADQLLDPDLAGTWQPVGFWIDGKPVAELILTGSSMNVEFMDPIQQARRQQRLLVRGNDTVTASPHDLRGITAELMGGWGVASAEIGTIIEFGYKFDGDLLRIGWQFPPDERPDSLEEDNMMVLTFRRYEDAPPREASNDPDTADVERALEGRWLFVPEDMRMVMLRGRMLYLGVPSYRVGMELEIIGWDADTEPRKMEGVVIGSPRGAELGDRHRMIYTEIAPGRVKFAEFYETSPMYKRWPQSFESILPLGLVTMEWERVDQ